MKVAISGSTGFVGSKVASLFQLQGHEILPLRRPDFRLQPEELAKKLSGSAVIIHLAGEPILQRWTAANRRRIYNSRINTTSLLTESMRHMNPKPEVFICASGVDIYPHEGVYTESAEEIASTFPGEVCRDWEREAAAARKTCRTLMFRFGVILGPDGGALQKMLLPFRLGLGGKIASGKQMMSWVHIEDVLGAMQYALQQPQLEGPVNVCAPGAVTNAEFSRILARTLHRPSFLPLPSFALRMVFGEAASLVTRGRTVVPEKLQFTGYPFRFPDLESALKDLLDH
ncbi:MAG: TIGR01777 family oxidoreductase [Bacteroidales bacterium]